MNVLFSINALCSLHLQSNIWIDEQGAARIAGFASATIMVESNITLEDVDKSVESDLSRWYSPEVLNPGSGSNMARETKASDMYSFGMLAYAVGLNF